MATGSAEYGRATVQDKWHSKHPSRFDTDEELTSYKDLTTYNNFYEFGIDKSDPAQYSGSFKPLPWKVSVEGAANMTGTFNLEDILKPHTPEDRIYRLRCVEGWSMVIPWLCSCSLQCLYMGPALPSLRLSS